MDDKPWKRAEIDSPCVNICVVHRAEGLCTGCLRTIDEISRWSAMTAAERATITQALAARAPRLRKRRGGRAARQKG